MNHAQAEGLAMRLCQSFPRSQIAPDVWIEHLLPLHHGPADAAVRQVVVSAEHSPTVAHVLSAYRGLLGTAQRGPQCPQCDGTGWVTCTDHPDHRGYWVGREDQLPKVSADMGCACNVTRPCACAEGQARRARWSAERTPA